MSSSHSQSPSHRSSASTATTSSASQTNTGQTPSYALEQWQRTNEAHEQRSVGLQATNLWQLDHRQPTNEHGAKKKDASKSQDKDMSPQMKDYLKKEEQHDMRKFGNTR